ncbi:MAG TPA: RNA 2',3'-cyclic phosphodiesterase [Steroidobacteraceae bacterium]|nr:RNA 2',3'-cyclic phosphodiesterase [Steroidobacteraceae bacterium]
MTPAAAAPARRVFFALWPSADERHALARATHQAAAASGGRPVPEMSLHATLAFLGSVPEARFAELGSIAHRVAGEFAGAARPPPWCFETLAHWARARVLVALAREERRAQALAARLKDLTAAAGFRPELKLFHAHVTVARKVVHASAAAPRLRRVEWRCDAFALIDSRTEAGGPVYSVVAAYPLVNAEGAR